MRQSVWSYVLIAAGMCLLVMGISKLSSIMDTHRLETVRRLDDLQRRVEALENKP